MTIYTNIELVFLIIKELFLITYNLFQYIWYILYYTYCISKIIRKWFEAPYEQHEIKVCTAGLLLIILTYYYFKFTKKIVKKVITPSNIGYFENIKNNLLTIEN